MLRNKSKKIIAGILIFSQLAFWPAVIFAQMAVPTSDSGNGNTSGGIAGTVQNTAESKALSGAFTAYQVCLKTVQAAEQAFAKANPGASTTAVLSPTGNSALLDAMNVLNSAYSVYLACASAQLIILVGSGGSGGLPASGIYTSNIKQQYASQIQSGIATYTKKQGDLNARIDNANQGFWKTLLISMLLQTSKSVADTMVSKLVNNYKISNLKQYADSAATLMYDNQFIRQNFPNAQDQLMARAILENPAFRTQIQPGIFVAADAALGYNPAAMNPASPNFYGQMAAMGSPSANPYYLQTAYVGGVDQSRASSMATAQQQISQGSGYKAPVNCAGTLVQQKQIDAQAMALQNQLANRQALLTNLQQAQQAGQNVSNADLLKATSDYNAAYNTWLNAPDAVTSSSGSTSTDPAIIMCEAISSPAVLVNQGIDSLFTAMGGNLSQYNSSNLPSYINIISGIVSQIGTSMVLGGASAGANTALLNENKAVSATVALSAQTTSSNAIANAASNPIIFYNSGADSQGNNTLSWNVMTSQLTTASYVIITSPSLMGPPAKKSLSDSMTVNPSASTSYTLTVYDPTGKSLGTSTLAVLAGSQQSYNYNPNAPTVLGAFTARPVIETRGPAVELSIR